MDKNKDKATENTETKKTEVAKAVSRFKRTKSVIIPLLKHPVNETVYMKITCAIYTGKKIEADKDPAQTVTCVDLTTAEECLYLVSSVLQGNLNEVYPDNGYVGKCFEIEKLPKRSGKAYNEIRLYEIEA